uniref:Uncharacterized protein n=1 Tax=Anguilla anguilla TaxID=7936 RepID=A0A0E9TCR4_ANGAN
MYWQDSIQIWPFYQIYSLFCEVIP